MLLYDAKSYNDIFPFFVYAESLKRESGLLLLVKFFLLFLVLLRCN